MFLVFPLPFSCPVPCARLNWLIMVSYRAHINTPCHIVAKLPCDDCDDSEVLSTDPSAAVTYLAKLRLVGTSKELYDISCRKQLPPVTTRNESEPKIIINDTIKSTF